MDINNLYKDLILAYSNDNLNLITGKLIILYKNKNYSKIREIANKISTYVLIDEEKDSKCFSRLMMLYHPDRGEQLRKTVQQLYEQNDYEKLKMHSHILSVADIDTVPVATIDDDIDYNPEYAWDLSTDDDGYGYTNEDEEQGTNDEFYDDDFEKSFYNMIKIREYGKIDIEFPTYYLEDFEEFEMAYCGLESLDGLEYCVHVKILDLSNNELCQIDNLWDLKNLEELYMANNQIGYIDILSNLTNLRILDLSGNQIDDISPLMKLEKLEYINLIGNPVPYSQIEKLEKKGIIVTTEKIKPSNLIGR